MILILISASEDLSDYEREFINEIFETMNVKMYNISFNILEDDFDVEEALSETFIKIINNIEKISSLPNYQVEPYCVTILKNETMNVIRNRKKVVHTDNIDCFYDLESEYSVEDEYLEIVSKERLLNCINKLSYEDRTLIHLRFANEMKFNDIGEFFNITEEAAKKRSQRILKKLRRYYREGDLIAERI